MTDSHKLQQYINKINDWTKTWLMSLNVSKCKVMHFGRSNPRMKYTLDGYELEQSEAERDLGLQVTTDLKSTRQANYAASKANRMLGLLKRTFISRDLYLWKKLYMIYIRPHLEFASAAWNPHLQQDIDTLEKVQWRATKIPNALNNLNKDVRLKAFGLTSLIDRRIRGDLIQQYKIHHKLEVINWFVSPSVSVSRISHRNSYQLKREIVKNCKERYHFFTNRIVPHWNSLSDEIINAPSVDSFKIRLDKFNLERQGFT